MIENIENIIIEILENVPPKPFLCLQMSSLLYVKLEDNLKLNPKVITGNLYFNRECIFKQDYSINDKINCSENLILDNWTGHCWVELDNTIIDLSIFRTIYSSLFYKSCKTEIINKFGNGRGCLILKKDNENTGFEYEKIDILDNNIINGILQGAQIICTQ